MNLLGDADAFRYPTFAAYVAAVDAARPAVNVAALAGHTALRSNHMDRLDRAATAAEIEAMRAQLIEALDHGALGLSTGSPTRRPARPRRRKSCRWPSRSLPPGRSTSRTCAPRRRDPCSHERSFRHRPAMPGAGRHLPSEVRGHRKLGQERQRSFSALETARAEQPVQCDCYPYAASSSTLDLRQVDDRVRMDITWSKPHPEMAGQTLQQIALAWGVEQKTAAARLQPAGAIYHCMSEEDVRRILQHPATMIGSDGLPNDPRPHPRLWGTFPRVLGYYCRDQGIFPLAQAVHKMTGMPAQRFGLTGRGRISEGCSRRPGALQSGDHQGYRYLQQPYLRR